MLGVSALSGAAIGDLGIIFENASASAAATTGFSADSTRVRTGGAISAVESSFAGVGIRFRNVSGTSSATATTSATAGYVKFAVGSASAQSTNTAAGIRITLNSAEILASSETSLDYIRVRKASGTSTARSQNTARAGYVRFGEGLISLTSSVSAVGRKKWQTVPEGTSPWTVTDPQSVFDAADAIIGV
jgi:hypothetical protein